MTGDLRGPDRHDTMSKAPQPAVSCEPLWQNISHADHQERSDLEQKHEMFKSLAEAATGRCFCQQGCGQFCFCVRHEANRGIYHSICCWSEQPCTSLDSSLSPDDSNLITCKCHIFPHSQCILHLRQAVESEAATKILHTDLAAMQQYFLPTTASVIICKHNV